MWNLENKKALISGGTKGIGRATAEEFMKLGAEVWITARTETDLNSMLEEYRSKGFKIFGTAADLSDPEQIQFLISAIKNQWNGLDILVNNAGMNIRKPTNEFSQEDFDKILKLNTTAVWQLSRLCYPWLKESKGSVVNVSSTASQRVVRTSTAAYAMSKAAIDQLTKFFAVEWGPDDIRVNAVLPWYTATPLVESVLSDPMKKENILSRTPLNRICLPEEVARLIAFLSMPAASYISGVCVPVDGGFSALGL
jgi:Tropinone reductase 1